MEMNAKHLKTFRTWEEYLKEARTFAPGTSSTGKADDEARKWAGTKCIGDALKIAEGGWKAGANLVSEVAAPIVDKLTREHVNEGGWEWDVTGADYDVGEYLNGTPECWITPTGQTTRPVITITANVTTSCGIPARMIEMRGAAVVALTLALQARGYIVRVYKCEGYPVSGDSDATFHRCLLSDENGGPLDTDRLLFALAHPSAARQIGYCIGAKIAGKDPGAFLGVPSDPKKDTGWHGDIYLPAAMVTDANWNDPESVSKWVESQYERLTNLKPEGKE